MESNHLKTRSGCQDTLTALSHQFSELVLPLSRDSENNFGRFSVPYRYGNETESRILIKQKYTTN